MSYSLELNSVNERPSASTGLAKRLGVLAYGMLAYVAGCVGLFWLILAFGGLAPVGLSGYQAGSTAAAVTVNIALIVLFGLQHTIMARPAFKKWLSRYLPSAAERSTFMLMSGVVSLIAIFFWQPMPGTAWAIENTTAQIVLWATYAAAWVYLLLATFVTNHFELMGLRQTYLYFQNKPYQALPFTRKFMYRYSRHPMMLGFLVGMWSVPVMGIAQLVMASLFTVYIFIGVYFEERDLMKSFGEMYRQYKKDIATFIPGIY